MSAKQSGIFRRNSNLNSPVVSNIVPGLDHHKMLECVCRNGHPGTFFHRWIFSNRQIVVAQARSIGYKVVCYQDQI
ncbi:hypothetical protein DERF_007656 [Dermatophagoides farinae]|uniref:Uncharacterized protein n=1 Tax=Dermatophagoides farinae TaxID=6954 RepID=A0A922HYM8_DERFA|nr:hypothetical protein DERF_007656 [Dermatophagoides farinae]